MVEEKQLLVSDDARDKDVTTGNSEPVTSYPASEHKEHVSLEAEQPLLQQSDASRSDPKLSETEDDPCVVGDHLMTEDYNDNVKIIREPSVTFSPNGLRRRDDVIHELATSPTASRATFGFGSLDIIMENDKPRNQENLENESDPYDRPERWGWAVVVASWIVMIPIAGVLASFGTIVSSLTADFNATKMEAGWIGSLAFSFTVGTCPLSTPLYTVYGARKVALVGVLGATLSVIVTSFTPVLHLMFLTYSAMLGVFANFVYNSAMNLTGQYFPNKHQALATCLASAGISFGTMLVNPLAAWLVSTIGWRHTLKVLGGGIFVIGLACVATFRPVKTKEQKIHTKLRHAKEKGKGNGKDALVEKKVNSLDRVDKEAMTEMLQSVHTESKISLAAQEIKKTVLNKNVWDFSFCNNPAFILWMVGTLFWSVSFLFPFIFLIDYMGTIGISRMQSKWVMTAYGIAEFSGRLLCALGAGKIRFSLAYVYAISSAFCGAATLLAPLGKTLGIMYAYSIAAGVNSGILNSLMYVGTMQFFGNETGRHIWGYINVMLAVGMVIGPVAAGGIYDATQSYQTAFYMGGSVFMLCAVVMMLIPIALNHFPPREREAVSVREKPSKVSMNGRKGSIVKPDALRKLAQKQAAMKASKKSKWNGEVHAHLQELDQIDEEVMKQNGHHTSKKVVISLPQDSDKERLTPV